MNFIYDILALYDVGIRYVILSGIIFYQNVDFQKTGNERYILLRFFFPLYTILSIIQCTLSIIIISSRGVNKRTEV